MSKERAVALYLARIYEQSKQTDEFLVQMRKVVELDPCLTPEERIYLNAAYKTVVNERRHAINILNGYIGVETRKGNQRFVEKLTKLKQTMINELSTFCYEFIEMVDKLLISTADTPEQRVFYEKLKADYYRYICEFDNTQQRDTNIEECRRLYSGAIEIARSELPPASPSFLSLILNYSVFLYDILGNKDEAIELTQSTYHDSVNLLDNQNNETYAETSSILKLLRENFNNWVSQTN